MSRANAARTLPRVPVWLATIVALNAVSGLTQIGQYGIAFPLVSLWLDAHGVAPWRIGALAAMPWVGMLCGIVVAPHLMHATTPRATVALGIVLCAVATLALPFTPLLLWLLPCALLGLGLGLRWIGNESWLYAIVPGDKRGRVVGIHETVIAISLALGPSLIAWAGLDTPLAFVIGASIGLLALIPLALAREPMPQAALQAPPPLLQFLAQVVTGAHRSLAMTVGLVGGVADTALLALLPVFSGAHGLDSRASALLVGLFGLGALVAQVPLGLISDRYGVRAAMTVCGVSGILAAGALLVAPLALLWPAVAVLGAVGGGLLTLAIVAATEGAADMRIAMSRVSLAFTTGSILGPPVTGALMQYAGAPALPAFTLTMSLLLLACIDRKSHAADDR